MKHWRKTSGVRTGRVASSFSLLICVAVALGGPFGDLKAKLDAANSPAAKAEILTTSGVSDADFAQEIAEVSASDPASVQKAVDYVELRAIGESVTPGRGESEKAKKIKQSATYHEDKEAKKANWLSGAAERIKNLLPDNRSRSGPQFGGMPGASGAGVLVIGVWVLLFALVLGFIVFALRFVSFGKLRKRKAKAMLEDDEPERTLDEWLALADAYQEEGRYREAVRALYLACLLKFDERNVARFMRGQTNWEHLARIEASPRKPTIDFRPPTQAFDQIWYGHKVRGPVDVDEFRGWYGEVSAALKEAA